MKIQRLPDLFSKVRTLPVTALVHKGAVVCELYQPRVGVVLAYADDVRWRSAGLALHDAEGGDVVSVVYEGYVQMEGVMSGRVYCVSDKAPGQLMEAHHLQPDSFLGLVGIGVNDGVLYVCNLAPKPIRVSAPVRETVSTEKKAKG